jgi:glycosyltransferase involved in cell wall biosynthesis
LKALECRTLIDVSSHDGPDSAPSPLVSVIIPAYRTAQYIGETLQSVFAQTFTDHEIIVVNDGSPDTPELEKALAPYRSRIRYTAQENRGLAGARNAGIRLARGQLFAFLDADDLWEPEFLASQVDFLRKHPGVDLVYADALIFGDVPEAGRRVMEFSPSAGEVTFERLVTRACTVLVLTVLARREAVIRAGLFDESLRRVEDADLWLRMIKTGSRIAYQKTVLARYRRRGGSLSTDGASMLETYMRVLDKLREMPGLTASEKQLVAAQHQREHADLRLLRGKQALAEGRIREALENLREANAHFRRVKLAAAILALRLFPGLARALLRLPPGSG